MDVRAIAFLAVGAALFLPSCGTLPTSGVSREGELASVIAGRVAGAPADCIYFREIEQTRVIQGFAIVYTMKDGMIFVNRPRFGASRLRQDSAPLRGTHSDRRCSKDAVVFLGDSLTPEATSVILGEFIPYAPADPSGQH